MEKYQAPIATLKQKLATAKDFKSVYEYFFDHLGEDRDFIDLSKPCKDKGLTHTVPSSGL